MRNHKIAIQGAISSFHDLAAKKFFGEDIEVIECGTFKEVCHRVANNSIDYGIIAIENKIAGSILLNYQLIDSFDLNIIGEVYLPIELHLLTIPGTKLSEIREIISHPIALAQCQNFLNSLENVKVTEFKDTATSAKLLMEKGDKELAVIAGPAVGREFGLEENIQDVGDETHNYTRFYILSKAKDILDGANKASITITAQENMGGLSQLLSIIKDASLNLTKIQSLPTADDPTKYSFNLDIEFEAIVDFKIAFKRIEKEVVRIKTLGVYPAGEIPLLQDEQVKLTLDKNGK